MQSDVNKKKSWYAVYCNTGQENKVADLIKIRANNTGLSDYIEEIYIPTQEKVTIQKGKKKTVTEKVFKGYIFIKMELNNETWPLIRDTQGVIGFAGANRQPTPISEDEINAIKIFCQQKNSSFDVKFSEGDKVKIVEGEFKGFTGTVKEINNYKGKVVVLVQFLGREVPVELEVSHISNL